MQSYFFGVWKNECVLSDYDNKKIKSEYFSLHFGTNYFHLRNIFNSMRNYSPSQNLLCYWISQTIQFTVISCYSDVLPWNICEFIWKCRTHAETRKHSTRMRTDRLSPWGGGLWPGFPLTETPHGQIPPLDRYPMDRDTPDSWTETPLGKDPLDRDSPEGTFAVPYSSMTSGNLTEKWKTKLK